MTTFVLAVLALLMSQSVTLACDLFCQPDPAASGTRLPCDINCHSNGGACSAGTGCDNTCPDGICVICGSDADDQITGIGGTDYVCMGGGNDTVLTKGGSDRVGWGIITNAAGQPVSGRTGTGGNKFIDTSSGNDQIFSGDGDDIILAGTGLDVVQACGGRNFVDGGDGDDTLETAGGVIFSTRCPTSPTPDDVVGSLLCGGGGNDRLSGKGPSHQCMDAGPGQVATLVNDCTYTFQAGSRTTPTAFDLGTARNCVKSNIAVTGESCGCD